MTQQVSFNANTNLNWNNGNNYIGDPLPNDSWSYPTVQRYYYDYYWPTYYPIVEKSKIDVAFVLAKMLIDEKFLEINKVKDFITLVDKIAKYL